MRIEDPAHASHVVVVHAARLDELADEKLRGAGAQLGQESALARGLACYHGAIAMKPPFFPVPHKALGFEGSQDGLDRRVGQFVRNPLANLGDRRRPEFPQHAHDVELALGEDDVHRMTAY